MLWLSANLLFDKLRANGRANDRSPFDKFRACPVRDSGANGRADDPYVVSLSVLTL